MNPLDMTNMINTTQGLPSVSLVYGTPPRTLARTPQRQSPKLAAMQGFLSRRHSTARTAGYNYSAKAMEPGTYDNSYADYFAHQETANAALQNVTSSHIVLAELLAKTTAELKALKMEMANLQKTNRPPLQASKLTSYCWTHGYVVEATPAKLAAKPPTATNGRQPRATKWAD